MMRSILFAVLFLTACATAGPEAVRVAPVVAAERAFAAHAAEHGWIPAFRAFTAPDGIVFQPEPVNSAETLAATPDDGVRSLQWWPAYAGIARSGDLGFTTGPFVVDDSGVVRGNYFTVWRKQPDGTWKWIFDGGVGVRDANPIARDAEPAALEIATRGGPDALNEIVEVEAGFAVRAGRDVIDPYREYLAEDGRLNRAGLAPAVGKAAALAAAGEASATTQFRRLGGAASSAGDLVFTYGEAAWTQGGTARRGHYCRIWQLRPEGWRIVFDQIIPRREPPPASGSG